MGVSYPENPLKEDGAEVVVPPSSTGGMFERLWELIPRGGSKNLASEATSCHLPETTSTRRRASVAEHSLERDEHLSEHLPEFPSRHDDQSKPSPPQETVLYLAYGSNLASKTFLGMRGIRPLSQINVIVPELRLTFDLPGLPYIEPCFAASQFRDASCKGTDTDHITDNELEGDLASEKTVLISQREHDYLPDDPLVGVVYEVTLTDYARIIATEGGGNGYKDIVIDCYPFSESYDPTQPIPDCPESKPFKAHTLLAPVTNLDEISRRAYAQRTHSFVPRSGPAVRKPGYSQPSARYLNLILTGAAEHNLPISYRAHLSRVPTYRITTVRQKMGRSIFLVTWGPLMLLVLTLSRTLAGPDGRSPQWLMKLSDIIGTVMWGSYEFIFRPLFGDGERTME
ncbi:hypothetical protein BDV32DRAFT_115706 [Aspergillus pseudonomiae]|uniref:gamma-glutamylcyclotransferase n=1 Tax=Aspergillus pseudonomiae TaxID=1506151 RepID=A0A5N6IHI3_9EURO|nr:uncharacterized protein BDV37DRAFT_244511 [Aspergillus pseudonomiae]KAB8265674.1 hypothetical protein BDV32DRAFT_115706 [Aspergillus pseudonomiae]KAE8405721.1 hypothetical protein BDV37DRAFT_244511 [Aspergillus pseudonomiae]